MGRIVVNADDFGMNSEVNHLIVEAFQKNLISSTTIMANMPGFDEACDLARRHGFIDRIGAHLNLTEGRPLTEAISCSLRFCDPQGNLRRRQTTLLLSRGERAAVKDELEAQVSRCLRQGIPISHLDSHHHIHTEWAIGAVAISIARKYGIAAIRLTRNFGNDIIALQRVYKHAYNGRLALSGLAKTKFFVYLSGAAALLSETNSDIEIMVHTRRTAAGVIVDCDGSEIERGIRVLNITNRLASYRELQSQANGHGNLALRYGCHS